LTRQRYRTPSAASCRTIVVIRRLGLAVLVAGMALDGLATGTAAAAPACADVHWIDTAGSGQRDGAGLNANAAWATWSTSRTSNCAPNCSRTGGPSPPQPFDTPGAGPVGGWAGWLAGLHGHVDDGTDATAEQFEVFTAQCPDTKVVLAGYSPGAMVIHRNLHDLADDPHVAAALLIADGDGLPADTTINMGSTAIVPGAAEGVAQEHSFLVNRHLDAAAGDRRAHRQRLRCGRPGLRLRPRYAPSCGPPASRYTPRTRPP
jgi:cutinase